MSLKADIYDPATNSWSSAGSLPSTISNLSATLLANGDVLVAGGNTPTTTYQTPTSLGTAELYNHSTNSWSSAGTMIGPRSSHAAALLPNGEVLVEGGINLQPNGTGGQTNTRLASAELYNPGTNSWSPAASLPFSRYGHTSTTLANGEVMVVEGLAGDSTNSSELYNPGTDSWSAGGNLTSTRQGQFTATLLQNGALLIVGGFNGSSVVTGVEIYQ